MDPVLIEPNNRISEALDHLKRELSGIRAGRANPQLLEEIPVEAYGGRMKMMEVGTISAPQPSLLSIQVWDASLIKAVEKAILEANLGLNPAVDGTTVRVPLPPLTEERREEFVKLAKTKGEEAKIQIRQIRQDTRGTWDKESESGDFGEDELKRREKILQDLIDKSVVEVDTLVKEKETDLRTI